MTSFQIGDLQCRRYVLGPLEVNTYLVYDPASGEGLVIDPAFDDSTLEGDIKALCPSSLKIFLTHGHADHIAGVEALRSTFKAELICSREDSPMLPDPELNLSTFLGVSLRVSLPDRFAEDQGELILGKSCGKFVSIPGHTPGGTALLFKRAVFSGDTLFTGSIGRSDFPGGNHHTLVEGIKSALLSLDHAVMVFPGHGPETTVGNELANNPWFD